MADVDYRPLKNSFISFTSILGDDTRERFIKDYISPSDGVAWEILQKMPKGKYGKGVNMILLAFYIEGDHDWFKMPKSNRLGPFAKSDKSWKFVIPLTIQKQKKINSSTDMRDFVADALTDLKKSLAAKEKKQTLPEDFDWMKFSADLDELISILKEN